MSRHNNWAVNGLWFLIQNTSNDVRVSEIYFPILLDLGLQIYAESGVEMSFMSS